MSLCYYSGSISGLSYIADCRHDGGWYGQIILLCKTDRWFAGTGDGKCNEDVLGLKNAPYGVVQVKVDKG